jgi:hypothetical protein
MDEIDGILLGLCIAGLASAVLLLAHAVRALQQDIEIIRMTVPVPVSEE